MRMAQLSIVSFATFVKLTLSPQPCSDLFNSLSHSRLSLSVEIETHMFTCNSSLPLSPSIPVLLLLLQLIPVHVSSNISVPSHVIHYPQVYLFTILRAELQICSLFLACLIFAAPTSPLSLSLCTSPVNARH